MSALSPAALARWRRWLRRRIRRRLAALEAQQPQLRRRVRRLARRRALASLGLADVFAQLRSLAAQRRDLDRRARQAHRALLALVRRVPLEQVPEPRRPALHPEVRAALRRRRRQHAAELWAEDPAGRALLGLRRERDELPETLALAVAGRPFREFWAQALALLGQEPTPLQRLALAGAAGSPARPAG